MVILFTLLNLLHTANHGVTCILCHFQDTLRAGNHTLQNDVSGLVFLPYVFLFFVGCVSQLYFLGVELPHTSLLHWDSTWASLHW